MKKLFVLATFGAFLISCNNESSVANDTKTDTSTHAANAYTASEGDVTYRNGKVLVWRNNEWVEADDDVRFENGIVVKRNGEVVRNDEVVVLKDGEVVDKSGRFFDKAGNAIEDAWDGAKKGIKKAGEEVKDVFTDDNKDGKDDKKEKK